MEHGTQDYADRKKLDRFFHHYPKLKEIVDVIGRDQEYNQKEIDSVTYKFLPTTIANTFSTEQVDRVSIGNNLEWTLPIELAMPDDLFYKRYVLRELQQFSAPGKDKPKKEEHQKEPRLTKGPIIVAVDTSGSMSGEPIKIAFSLIRQLLSLAKKQKRPCFLISFSVRAKSIDLSKPRNWRKVDDFLSNRYTGGTDGEQMLAEAIRVLQKGTYEMADVLIVSDLEFPLPRPETQEKIKHEQKLGTKFYALLIGYGTNGYHNILDKIWRP